MMQPQQLSRFSSLRRVLYVSAAAMIITACSENKNDLDSLDEGITIPVEELYNDGKNAFDSRDYETAVEKFELVEQQHPYSEWATRSQIMAAYANYQMEEYDSAIAILDRFTRMHPGNENIAYAYYLTALCYYEQISDVGREQSMTEQSRRALTEVVRRFPESEYARAAKLKLDLATDHLAGKEMEVGRYYLKRGDLLAAINRFKLVVENYQTTTHAPEALHRLTEAYLSLGVDSEAKKYAAVLGYNYPDSEWYKDSYKLLVKDSDADDAPQDTRSFWQRWTPGK
ncbi:MAG: outer membrane protein assembly factor BamD [Alphaproteobacteria bacterium]|nr:outer membrane protein assembly factor BamD [Alphaproteobacteria bacterium]